MFIFIHLRIHLTIYWISTRSSSLLPNTVSFCIKECKQLDDDVINRSMSNDWMKVITTKLCYKYMYILSINNLLNNHWKKKVLLLTLFYYLKIKKTMNSKGLERQEFKEMAKIFQIILSFFYLRLKKKPNFWFICFFI